MEFKKPTFLVNPEICKSNIRNMASKASASGILFRPHFKTHQSRTIGRWFHEAGVRSITVSSLSAALYFADDGWEDITVAFPLNLREMDLVNALASRIRLGVLIEDVDVFRGMESELLFPVDAYIKIDSGYQRTGLSVKDFPLILKLAELIKESDTVRLKGLITHAGQAYRKASLTEIKAIYESSTLEVNTIVKQLGYLGTGLIRSCGDTPTCSRLNRFENIDEIRPGNFIFYDLMQMEFGSCEFGQIGGIVVCPVVAIHSDRNQAILYGGAVHFSKESIAINGRQIYGQMIEVHESGWSEPVAGGELVSLSQEHGVLEAPANIIGSLRPGSLVGIVPVHSCLTASALRSYQILGGEKADYFPGI